jgi:hypothetical protein
MEEIWKDIEGFESLYQVSNMGQVKSYDMEVKYPTGTVRIQKGRILKPGSNMGYPRVNLCKDKKVSVKLVHRLVAEAFLPNADNKKEVNHIDGVKSNACVDNLEWVTSSENSKHAFRTGLSSFKVQGDSRKPIIMLDKSGKELRKFPSVKDALLFLGKDPSTGILGASIRFNRNAYGYKWRWA